MFVCLLSSNYSFVFAPIVTKFGHPVGLVEGKFNEGIDLGSKVPGDPRGQKC